MPLVVIFLGAFLAFLIQPMVGNTLLPVFGGSASVWSSCLASFQVLLVAGYLYAHKSARLIRRRGPAAWLHVLLLLLSAGWLYLVARHYGWMLSFAGSASNPAFGSVVAVLTLAAIPCVLLSSNSSLVQDLSGGRYGLYAISNLGSFCGLLAYPFAFELKLSLPGQWLLFSALMLVYAVMFAVLVACRSRSGGRVPEAPVCESGAPFAAPPCLPFFALSFASCYLLNAVSVHLCSDITPLPMVWVILLSLYLVSYIVAFTERGAALARYGAVIVVPLSAWAFLRYGRNALMADFVVEFATAALVLLFGGWLIHSRLYRMRPAGAYLTKYYLMIALGGAFGGVICSFVMPLVSSTTAEYPIAIVLILSVVYLDVREELAARFRSRVRPPFDSPWIVPVALVLMAAIGVAKGYSSDCRVLCRYRNFYGIGSVLNCWIRLTDGGGYFANELRSGGTTHGYQKVDGEWKGQMPTTYYSETAGGLAITSHPKSRDGRPMRVGICGMGIGTMATYSRRGDYYRFFEINPDVERIARDERLFSFLSKSLGTVDVVVDDARRALEKEEARGEPQYDVLVVDVFSGDAIPVHMATREAVAIYLKRLREDGILAFHISSWHMDFRPMVKAIAAEFALHETTYYCEASQFGIPAEWALFSRGPLDVRLDRHLNARIDLGPIRTLPMMSDERHSIVPYLSFGFMIHGAVDIGRQ